MKTSLLYSVFFSFLAFSLLFNPQLAVAQSHVLDQINQDVWQPFYEAYAQNDPRIMANLYRKDGFRISPEAQSVFSYREITDAYRQTFADQSAKGITQQLRLNFTERTCSENAATERGIYALTLYPGTPREATFYGKFHMLLRKEYGRWKIFMEYEWENEEPLSEADFEKGTPMEVTIDTWQ